MKKNFLNTIKLAFLAACVIPVAASAQKEFYGKPSNWRPKDKTGIHMFETPKVADTIPFEGPRVRFGAGFTQSFQNLKHENTSRVPLYEMGPGFNLAQANLFTDIQLADGIRLDVTTYLSTRHHNETWVKGGYIQFDKLPFKGKFWSDLMELATIKIGHFEINYGDQHFRRTDAGHALYNPFVENYIADAFSTEIGGEVYLQKNGFFGMVGMTNGTINSSISKQAKDAEADSSKNPAFLFKAGVDKVLGNKVRARLTGSAYINNRSQRNVLYAGDRAGSNYFGVMDPKGAALTSNFTSGRFSPNFTRNVQAIMLNGFVKVGGFEVFGTLETAKGNAANETKKRQMNQTAIEGIYRLGARENVFVGARYNTVNAEMPGFTEDVKIDRSSLSAGWFLTQNVLLKGEYSWQNYTNFEKTTPAPNTSIFAGGKFNGYVIQAVIGF